MRTFVKVALWLTGIPLLIVCGGLRFAGVMLRCPTMTGLQVSLCREWRLRGTRRCFPLLCGLAGQPQELGREEVVMR